MSLNLFLSPLLAIHAVLAGSGAARARADAILRRGLHCQLTHLRGVGRSENIAISISRLFFYRCRRARVRPQTEHQRSTAGVSLFQSRPFNLESFRPHDLDAPVNRSHERWPGPSFPLPMDLVSSCMELVLLLAQIYHALCSCNACHAMDKHPSRCWLAMAADLEDDLSATFSRGQPPDS